MTSALQATSFKFASIPSLLLRLSSISKAQLVLIPSKLKAGGLLKSHYPKSSTSHNSLKCSIFWALLLSGKLWWQTLPQTYCNCLYTWRHQSNRWCSSGSQLGNPLRKLHPDPWTISFWKNIKLKFFLRASRTDCTNFSINSLWKSKASQERAYFS